MTTRKYQMTKLHDGSYLLPSNDAKTLWRLAKGADGWYSHSRLMPSSDAELACIDWDDWNEWEARRVWGPFRTRAEAIDVAVREQ